MNHNATDENSAQPSLLFAQLKFAYLNYKFLMFIPVVFLVFLISDWVVGWVYLHDLKVRWNSDIDQIVSLATLMVALFVWYGEIVEDWKNNLPKRLTLRFENDQGELVLLCIKAHLSDVADMRTLGQQIGSQMCDNNRNLEFRAPYIIQSTGKVLYDREIGYFQLYCATFTFTNLPNCLTPGQYREWQAPFRAEDLKTKDRNA